MKIKNIFSKIATLFLVAVTVIYPIAPVFALGELPSAPSTPTTTTTTTTPTTPTTIVTPPADTTPPVISGVLTSNVLPTGVTITWTVNELSTFSFEYGTSTSYGSQAALDAGATLAGTAVLTGLSSSTAYYYCIHATDTSANTSQSCGSFTTSTPPDITPPVIAATTATSVTTSSATVTWTTNEGATSQVEYGTSSGYGSQSSADTTLALSHSVDLSDLLPNTTYHYQVKSTDANGNIAVSGDIVFTTSALPVQSSGGATVTITDTTPPVIVDVSAVSLEPHNATILWTTDELAMSTLEYGTTTNYGSHVTLPADALLSHSATLLELTPATKYYYCIHATDVAGNASSSCSSANSFTTAAQQVTLDTLPPTVSLVTIGSISEHSATVTWTTDELSEGYVEYGTTDGYGSETQLESDFTLSHGALLNNLSTGTTYHYRVHTRDAAGNAMVTPDNTFTTTGASVAVTPPSEHATTPPVISGLSITPIGETSETIEWATDQPAVSTLRYSTTTNYGSSATLSTSAAIGGTATLTGLQPATTYYFCITATNAANQSSDECGRSFTTLSVVLPPPTVNIVVVSSVSSSQATIGFSTNQVTSAEVDYGLTVSYGLTSTDSNFELVHHIVLSSLQPNTTYHYRVRVTNGSGNTTTTPDGTFTTEAIAPGQTTVTVTDTTPPVISDVGNTSLGTVEATLAWTTDEPAVSTLEYGTTTSYGTQAPLPTTLLLAHTATLTNLTPSTTYYYCIHATDLADNGADSCGHSFITGALVPPPDTTPPVVTLLTATPTSSSQAIITFTTNELANTHIDYGTSTSYGSVADDEVLTLNHTVALSGLLPNTTYHYRVTATDESGNQAVSSDGTFTTQAAPLPIDTTPPIISNLGTVTITANDAMLSWQTNEPAVSTLEYGTTVNYGSHAILPGSLLTSHVVTLVGLQPDTTYYYCIHATDVVGNTANSCGHSITTTTPPDTTPPTITLATVASVSLTSAEVSWETNEPATSQVRYGVTSNYGSSTPNNTSLDFVHNVTISGLTPNTTYHYQIASTDASGNTATTADATFTTESVTIQQPQDTTPPVISQVAMAEILAHTATITWETNEPATSTLEYGISTSYGSSATISGSALLAHDATLTNLAPDTSYYYCIHATDLAGNTASSCGHWFMTAPTQNTVQIPSTQPISGQETTGSVQVSAPVSVLAPIISSVEADSIGEDSARITWATNIASDSKVEYGDNMEFSQSVSSPGLVTEHSMVLSSLTPDTTYDFRVISTLGGTNAVQTTSPISDFTTLANPVVIDPAANILSVHVANVTASTALVTWTTESTTGTVEYGANSSYGQTTSSESLAISHELSINGLTPDTTYHFRVKAVDQADNITYSTDNTFTTLAVSGSTTGSSSQPSSTSGGAPTGNTSETTLENSSSTSPNNESVSSGSSSGGAPVTSGGGGSYGIVTPTVPAPAVVSVAPADSQTVFIWNNPQTSGFSGTLIIRKEGSYPTSPTDGQVLYKGDATTFTDTNLQNGKSYYYAMYSYGSAGAYSAPAHFTSVPMVGVHQVQLDENPVLESDLAAQHFADDLKQGSKSLEVVHLQQILNVAGTHQSRLTTGYFGPLTKAALKKFQAKYNLAQTGIVDQPTRSILNSISQGWTIVGAPTDIANLDHDLQSGDSGDDVANLQEFLAYEGSYEEGYITGYFGSLTKESVADFQQKYGVTPISGYVGYKTRHTIQTVAGM